MVGTKNKIICFVVKINWLQLRLRIAIYQILFKYNFEINKYKSKNVVDWRYITISRYTYK